MGKLLKFLKPYAGAVVAIICILVVQAYCDLSLPTYTSDIVNVGIQQGGIDETVPDTISKKDLNHLLLLVPSDKQELVKNAYTKSTKKYDYKGTVMELKSSVKEDDKKMEKLSDILGKPMLLAAGFDSGSDMTQRIEDQMRTNMKKQVEAKQAEAKAQMSEVPDFDKMDIYDMLNFMGAEGRDALIKQMNKKMNSMQDSIIEQAASTYIKDAYTHVGIDTDQIETSYILHTGAKMLALAFDGITSLSIKPIRMITSFGFIVALVSFIFIIVSIIQKFVGTTVTGWTSTIAVICFVSGVQLICMGVLGEYIGKIYMEVKHRPRYIISERTEDLKEKDK